MSNIESSLSKYSKVLDAKFQSIKATATDSGVKGDGNEKILSEFLEGCSPGWKPILNCQIVDSFDSISDEVDIAICNDHQFFTQPGGGVLLVEGVDFVVQSKAMITDSEIDRVIKNSSSVKTLKKAISKGSQVSVPKHVSPENINYVPYFCFAFSSELKPATVKDRLNEKCKDVPFQLQPDIVVLHDRGTLLVNGKDGTSTSLRNTEGPIVGWVGIDTGENTLLEFIRHCVHGVPRVAHANSPVSHYFKRSKKYDSV